MTRETLEQIFEEADSNWKGDNAFQGLKIISKYIAPEEKDLIQGADHDVIYGPGIDELLEAGLTEEHAKELAQLNWSLDDEVDTFQCFV